MARPKGFEPLTSVSGGRGRQYNRSKNPLKQGTNFTQLDLSGLQRT